MPGRRVFDLIEIPDEFWQHADVLDALRRRDIGRLFVLLIDATGVSQTRLAIACDTTQPKISGYMRGVAKVEELDVFERIADGLNMPDPARIALGLAPAADPTSRRPPRRLSRHGIPARPCLLPLYPVCSAQMQETARRMIPP